jgi:hypothetical protein
MVKLSIWDDSDCEINRFKWIASEDAGYDLGDTAIDRWIMVHWNGYLRARWLDHLYGKTYWIELDRGDFGILPAAFQDQSLLLDRIVDRIKAGQENLQIVNWGIDWHINSDHINEILTAINMNCRRISHRFELRFPLSCPH